MRMFAILAPRVLLVISVIVVRYLFDPYTGLIVIIAGDSASYSLDLCDRIRHPFCCGFLCLDYNIARGVLQRLFCLQLRPLRIGHVLDRLLHVVHLKHGAIIGDDVYNNVYLPARKKIKSAETIGYIGGTMMGVGVGLAAGDLVSSALYGTTGDSRRYLVYGGITLVGLIPTLVSFSMVKN